jgi:hypothetical protein
MDVPLYVPLYALYKLTFYLCYVAPVVRLLKRSVKEIRQSYLVSYGRPSL